MTYLSRGKCFLYASLLLVFAQSCDSTTNRNLTNDPKLLEDLLNETTLTPATITFVDDSVYSTDAYRVTVRADTLEWFEHDTAWYAAGLNDVASVSVNHKSVLGGILRGAYSGPVLGAIVGVALIASDTTTPSNGGSTTGLSARDAATILLASMAIGEVVGIVDGIFEPTKHVNSYLVHHDPPAPNTGR